MRFNPEMTVRELLPAVLDLGMELQDIDNVALRVGEKLQTYVWLESNLTVYVSPTGVDDVTDPERGMSAAKPWKSPQFALNRVCSVYNFNEWSVYVNLADGDYTTYLNKISIPKYTSTLGKLFILGSAQAIIPELTITTGSMCNVRGCTIESKTYNSNGNRYFASASGVGSTLYLDGVNCLCGPTETGKNTTIISVSNAGLIRISSKSPLTLTLVDNPALIRFISCYRNSMVEIQQDINIIGDFTLTTEFALVATGSMLQFINGGTSTDLGRAGKVNHMGGTATGRRYQIHTNGIILGTNGDENFFPGSVAGTTATGGQYA